jgi:hypothetical protein
MEVQIYMASIALHVSHALINCYHSLQWRNLLRLRLQLCTPEGQATCCEVNCSSPVYDCAARCCRSDQTGVLLCAPALCALTLATHSQGTFESMPFVWSRPCSHLLRFWNPMLLHTRAMAPAPLAGPVCDAVQIFGSLVE